MSGNLWMVSDLLDDEDLTMMQRDFITYYQGADYYGLGLKVFTRLAHEAGAVYKLGRNVLVRRDHFEEYLRTQNRRVLSQEETSASPAREYLVGTLVVEPKTGKLRMRLGIDEYSQPFPPGAPLDVLVAGEWVLSHVDVDGGWILSNVPTKDLTGLTVRVLKE